MSTKRTKLIARLDSGLIEIKSKFDAEFRRFSISRLDPPTCDKFINFLRRIHQLHLKNNDTIQEYSQINVSYVDVDGDLLPITNNVNFYKALTSAKPLLRIFITLNKNHENIIKNTSQLNLNTPPYRSSGLSRFLTNISFKSSDSNNNKLKIGPPKNFRQVSAIIDVDVLPETHRRVKLMKDDASGNKPLGFYIRDGQSIRVTPQGLEKVPAFFISRLVPGGLAESTGLLAVNDEVLEVNGIDTAYKSLDQVTDMMVANSTNLILTIKPANQKNNIDKNKFMRGDRYPSNASKGSEEYQAENINDSSIILAGNLVEDHHHHHLRDNNNNFQSGMATYHNEIYNDNSIQEDDGVVDDNDSILNYSTSQQQPTNQERMNQQRFSCSTNQHNHRHHAHHHHHDLDNKHDQLHSRLSNYSQSPTIDVDDSDDDYDADNLL